MAYYKDRKTYFRSKYIALTERDELAFSRVLREFEPGVMFFDDGDVRSEPVSNIPSCLWRRLDIALPSPGQERQWKLNIETRTQMVTPWVSFRMERSVLVWPDPTKKWAFDPPLISHGHLDVGYPKSEPELKPFAMKLLRLVNKVTTKSNCVGLDAALWSQNGGDVRRGIGPGLQFPRDEVVKLNKYYDDTLWDDRLPDEPTGVRVEY
tara:strand:+ start:127514 stop:128137 length:624 start_codon:yes stop_codon:yes gene_type:complete